MRRVTLTVFFFLAACGGADLASKSSTYNPSSSGADRQKFLLGPEAAAIIRDFARNYSEQAIDACLNSWVGDAGPEGQGEGPIHKPDGADLRGFMAECLAGSSTGGNAVAYKAGAR